MKNRFHWTKLINGLAAACIPYFLILFAVRILLNPFYAQLEYNLPNFPPDLYGFSKEERLLYAVPSIRYLTNSTGIHYLADIQFPDGTPIYNERELSHMADVKNLVQTTLTVWYGVTVFLAAVAVIVKATGRWKDFRIALGWGGAITIGLILFGVAGIAINFDWLFTEFHHLFFEGETWIFLTSDTLIRLFPEKFWVDAFIYAFAMILLGAGLLIWQGLRTSRRNVTVQ